MVQKLLVTVVTARIPRLTRTDLGCLVENCCNDLLPTGGGSFSGDDGSGTAICRLPGFTYGDMTPVEPTGLRVSYALARLPRGSSIIARQCIRVPIGSWLNPDEPCCDESGDG